MKIKAAILSLCLLVYLTELVALPISFKETPKKMCCAGEMKMAGHHSCPKAPNNNIPVKDCNSCKDCLNCPLCYTITINEETITGKTMLPVTKIYPAYQSTYSYQYFAAAWKPPNIA